MSYTARNASRYKLSEYNWLAWSRSYGCPPDVNAQCICAVQGPGRWRHRASAAAVGSEMRRRRSLSPVRSTSARCTASADSGSSGRLEVGDGILTTVGWLAGGPWRTPGRFVLLWRCCGVKRFLLLSGSSRQCYSFYGTNDNYSFDERRRLLHWSIEPVSLYSCVGLSFSLLVACFLAGWSCFAVSSSRCVRRLMTSQAKVSQAKVLTGGFAQVDVPLSVSHSCVW